MPSPAADGRAEGYDTLYLAAVELDQCVRSKQLVDLHAHLMGQGSDDFWVSEVILGLLAQHGPDASPRAWSDIIEHCKALLHPDMRSQWDPQPKISEHETIPMDRQDIVSHFTADVVYSLERLCVSMFPTGLLLAMARPRGPAPSGNSSPILHSLRHGRSFT